MRPVVGRVLLTLCVLSLCAAAPVLSSPGDSGRYPDVILTVAVEAGGASATYAVPVSELHVDSPTKAHWSLHDPVVLYAGATPLASLTDLAINFDVDPQVTLSFAVVAGATDTRFTLMAGTLSFPAMTDPSGTATAAMTLTDANGNGAYTKGQWMKPGPVSYRAGTDIGHFVYLLDDMVASPNGSQTVSGFYAGVKVGQVSSMDAKFDFILSAGDLASGTSSFTLVPEPGALLSLAAGVVGLGGLMFRRSG